MGTVDRGQANKGCSVIRGGPPLDHIMQTSKYARYTFQLVVYIVFTMQMFHAVEKYFSHSTITTSRTESKEDIPQPDIYLCLKDNGFDSAKAREHGYPFGLYSFLEGRVNKSYEYRSWEGNNGVPYQNITAEFYMKPASEIRSFLQEVDLPWHFTAINGFCRHVKPNLSLPFQEFFSNDEFVILFTDPGKSFYFSVITDSFQGDNLYTEANYTRRYVIDFEEIKWMERAGQCTIYGKEDTFASYADCVANNQAEKLFPLLNCSIPWMASGRSQSRKSCTGKVTISRQKMVMVSQMLTGLLSGLKYRIFDFTHVCKKPCHEIHFTSTLIGKIAGQQAGIGLWYRSNVVVTEEIFAYGSVDLLIEVGSALGLWVGLSALGMFDLLLEACSRIKKLLPKFM